uniref:Uncharacterized protein n=1 Tax=Kalanchoe fedtschenkoi TaxID=63787 RepID=A0A7N0UC70_KALFE
MASNSSPSSSRSEPPIDRQLMVSGDMEPAVLAVIESLKQQLTVERRDFVKKRVEENRKKMVSVTNKLFESSQNRRQVTLLDNSVDLNLLSERQKDAVDMQNGAFDNADDGACSSLNDKPPPSVVLLGSGITVRSSVCPIKLPEVKRLPPYTTWIFLDKNQRMTEDQSIVGRRRIYYDQNGGEALICSDSEEEAVEDEVDKREFVEAEQFILRNTIEEIGLSDVVLDSLAKCLSRKPSDIKARYEFLAKQNDMKDDSEPLNHFLEKDLDAALDSFDNLFCRRCLVFDCKLHGCSQDLVFPHEKPSPWSPPDNENTPCSPRCYRLDQKQGCAAAVRSLHDNSDRKHALSTDGAGGQKHKKKTGSNRSGKNFENEGVSSSDSEFITGRDISSLLIQSPPSTSMALEKVENHNENSKRFPERVSDGSLKRQKKVATSDSDSIGSRGTRSRGIKLRSDVRKENENAASSSQERGSPGAEGSERKGSVAQESDELCLGNTLEIPSSKAIKYPLKMSSQETSPREEFAEENVSRKEASNSECWRTIETDLFNKGIEIFGRNSCLIARNTLSGLKTCSEVHQYMRRSGSDSSLHIGDGAMILAEGHSKADLNDGSGNTVRRRSKFLRRRGKLRRLKYTGKSAAYQSYRKRISESKNMPCRQYNPCGCQTACGKDCACLANGTCCEKYCGCPKTCKNRFRGCHCAKSQCRSRQCPCFAADRECDPDVCRNCWVSCGDGSLGTPYQRGDNYECRNMKLLLKQQQRVLLGRSDVQGWGAFLKNTVNKNEFLGEYTGELISHREADKRGKIYDRENSSFLFNLNDQFVLDAFRKGDKLKFANHSPNPNCYAKVMMVAGDHRVGIFAKERIISGEELFYDYRYEPDRAPAWARKPEASGSKKDDPTAPSIGRAKKLA